MARACDFYDNKLCLTAVGLKPDGKLAYRRVGGTVMALFPEEGGTKADHTAASDQVADTESTAHALKGAGGVFEDCDFPARKTIFAFASLAPRRRPGSMAQKANFFRIHAEMA